MAATPRNKEAAERALRLQNYAEAIVQYRAHLDANPADSDSWFNLAWSYRAAGNFHAALDAYQSALTAGVRDPADVHANRAAILSEQLGNAEAAVAALETALTLDPRHSVALVNLGTLHEDGGDREAAIATYRRLLAVDPHHPRALARLAALTDYPSRLTDTVAGLLEDPSLSSEARVELGFALARWHDHAGDFAAAFDRLQAANATARADLDPSERYDPIAAARMVDAIIASFPAAAAAPAIEPAPPTPIFICGMFRSGSTLVEHILAAHPDVVAGGELEALPLTIAKMFPHYPFDAANASPQAIEETRRLYEALVGDRAEPPRFLTDKRPDNILHIGLVKRLFPAARIVITRRQLLDNLLSIYFLDFTRSVPYAFDLEEAAHWAGLCRRLTRHWQSIYPGDIHVADYDRLVTDPDSQIGELLRFLGLPPSDACRTFYLSNAAVRTPSAWQVRKPLFTTSSGRAENYRHELGDRMALLEEIASRASEGARAVAPQVP